MNKEDNARLWVVIAAFNEATVIFQTVTDLLSHVQNVVVCDDYSTDETSMEAKKAGAHVLSHPINLGQGAALQTGILYALAQGAEFIVTFDADGQHDPQEILPMFSALHASGCDVVLGSRFLGAAYNIPLRRRLLLKSALFFTRITSRIRISDVHNGFRILTRSFCESFEFQQNRMAHASEILSYISVHKVKYLEYPVTVKYTDYSQQKGQKASNAFGIVMELLMGRVAK